MIEFPTAEELGIADFQRNSYITKKAVCFQNFAAFKATRNRLFISAQVGIFALRDSIGSLNDCTAHRMKCICGLSLRWAVQSPDLQ